MDNKLRWVAQKVAIPRLFSIPAKNIRLNPNKNGTKSLGHDQYPAKETLSLGPPVILTVYKDHRMILSQLLPCIVSNSGEHVLVKYCWCSEHAIMMTASNGNIFRVTGHLCGEIGGHRWIPCRITSDAEFDVFFDPRLNKRLTKYSSGWWFETPSCPLLRPCNI